MHDDPSRTTPLGMIRYSHEFMEAALVVDEKIGRSPGFEIVAPIPVLYLVGHSIELSLKSYLLQQGITLRDLRRNFGHSLHDCFRKAKELGLAPKAEIVDYSFTAGDLYEELLLGPAYAIADVLSKHPKVKGVYYPGLASHHNHDVAKSQMSRGFGGMIGFDIGTIEACKRFVNSVKLCTLATSLGGVETVLQHSASMTHSTFTRGHRLEAGITDGLIRLSVGIEDVDELIVDIAQALDKI